MVNSQSSLYRYCINLSMYFFQLFSFFQKQIFAKMITYQESHECVSCESLQEQSLSIFQEKFANSIANLLKFPVFFKECVYIAETSGIKNISTYSWFLLQFWPTHWTASKMLHHTSRSRIRHMVQAQLFQESNPDAHYANAV